MLRLASIQEGKTVPLLTNCSRAEYVPGDPNDPARSRSGYLLYAIEGSLLAQPFDSRRLRLVGDPIPAGQEIWPHALIGAGPFSASNNGVLASRGAAKPGAAGLDRPGRPGDGFRRPGRRIRIGATLSRLPKSRRQPCQPPYGLEGFVDR